MAREIDLSKPLDEETIAHLRERYSNEYVDRMIYLANGGDADGEAEQADGDEAPEDVAGLGTGDGVDSTEPTEQEDGEDPSDGEEDEEDDLIGDASGNAVGTTYNPADHTAEEVIAYLKSGNVGLEERQAVLQLEKDGRGRVSILRNFSD